MADGSPVHGAAGAPSRAELHRLRDRIDAIDREIVALLNERAAIAIEIGQVKRAGGESVVDEERERQVLDRVAATNDGPLPTTELEAIYRRLIAATRDLQERSDAAGAAGQAD
jgi:chorismate mutase / prephenate dehydratase